MSGPKSWAVIVSLLSFLSISFCFRPCEYLSLNVNPSRLLSLRRLHNPREAFASHLAAAALDGGAWADAIKEYAKATKPAPKKSRHNSLAVESTVATIDVQREAMDFFGSMKIPFSISTLNKTRVRSRSKLAVQPLSRWGGIKLGLYRPQSHDVEERIGGYPEHYAEIDEAAAVIKAAALAAGARGYQRSALDSSGKGSSGFFRYVQLSVERDTGKIQLVIVWNARDSKAAGEPLQRFIKELRRRSTIWHSISVNFNEAESNAIFDMSPASWKLFYGPPYAKESIGGMSFCFPPQAFRQSNLDAFESLILPSFCEHIRRAYRAVLCSPRRAPGRTKTRDRRTTPAPDSSRPVSVLELYAGVGVLGVHAAAAVLGEAQPSDDWRVVCADSNPFISNTVFRHGLGSLPEAHRHKLRYLRATAEEAVSESLGLHEDCDVLVVNPPRRGLSEAVMKMLLSTDQHAIRRVIYIGCGFEALRQNVRALVDSRRWRILAAEGFDLFPTFTYTAPAGSSSSSSSSRSSSSIGSAAVRSGSTGGGPPYTRSSPPGAEGASDDGSSGGAPSLTPRAAEAAVASAGGRSHIETMVVLDRLAPIPAPRGGSSEAGLDP